MADCIHLRRDLVVKPKQGFAWAGSPGKAGLRWSCRGDTELTNNPHKDFGIPEMFSNTPISFLTNTKRLLSDHLRFGYSITGIPIVSLYPAFPTKRLFSRGEGGHG